MNLEQRFDRFDRMRADGLIARGEWTGEREGKRTACVLAALSEEVAECHDPSACPSYLMPEWLAHLTPKMDDNGSLAEWPGFVERYGALARRWAVLTSEDWRRLDFEVRAIVVREAASHTKTESVLAVCSRVVDLCSRVVLGDEPSTDEWRAAAAAAATEAEAAAWRTAAAAAAAAAESAWDRMNAGILDAIDRACVKRELPC